MTWRDRLSALLPRRRRPPVAPEALDFLPPVEQVLARPVPAGAHLTLHAIALFLCVGLVAAAVAEVDVVVVGTGKLATTAPPVIIQPLDRSIIRSLEVRPGDVVRKGQQLATLDATESTAELEQITTQHHAIAVQVARLEAELAGRPYVPTGHDADSLLQEGVARQRADVVASRLDAFDQSIRRLEASLAAAEGDAANLGEQIATAREVLGMRRELLESQSGSRLQFLETQNMVLGLQREQRSAQGAIFELRHAIAEKQSERRAFLDDWRRQAAEQLVQVRLTAGKSAEMLTKARHRHGLVRVVAPQDAVVLEVADRTTGSVLREAEPLIVLVPLNSPLVADIQIPSADVGYLTPGDPVRLKVDAFPFQRHGLLRGSLGSISQASFPSEGGEGGGSGGQGAGGAVHRGQVALTETALRNQPEGSALIPGMTLRAEVKVGTRTVLSYLLWPLLRGLDEGLREP